MDDGSAHETEIGQLARICYDGWRDVHERILPSELARDRTLESCACQCARLRAARGADRILSLSKTMSCINFMFPSKRRNRRRGNLDCRC